MSQALLKIVQAIDRLPLDGTFTQAQLKEASGASTSSIASILPRLMRLGLVVDRGGSPKQYARVQPDGEGSGVSLEALYKRASLPGFTRPAARRRSRRAPSRSMKQSRSILTTHWIRSSPRN